MNILIVGLGGFLGAISRYGFNLFFSNYASFPWATLLVNVLGCLVLALLSFVFKPFLSPTLFLFLTTGFLGAFTTFSAFGLETFRLMQTEQLLLALANILVNLFFGLLAFYIVAKMSA